MSPTFRVRAVVDLDDVLARQLPNVAIFDGFHFVVQLQGSFIECASLDDAESLIRFALNQDRKLPAAPHGADTPRQET